MPDGPDDAPPPYGREVATAMLFAGTLGLVVNHVVPGSATVARLLLLAFNPLAVFLGVGGLVEPKTVVAVGKYGNELPAVYKVIGGALAAAGVVPTILLLLFVYPLG